MSGNEWRPQGKCRPKDKLRTKCYNVSQNKDSGSPQKARDLRQNQGGAKFQPAGILKYVEDLKRGPNTEIGPKDYFEMGYNDICRPVIALTLLFTRIVD